MYKIKYPDYDNSILSVASSILAHYGAGASHRTLPALDRLLAKNYKNVVVMLYDGMGTAILKKHLSEDSFFRRNLIGVISSVFPPTTTAATMSVETGLSPIEHGWLGWSLYFPEVGANVSILPNTISGSGGVPAADYHLAERFMPQKTIFEQITKSSGGKVRAISISKYSACQAMSSKEICDKVEGLCLENSRKYIYTYWNQPDYDMHSLGTDHEKITAYISQFNDEVENMCKKIHDTLVIVIADHGLVDTEWRYLHDYPDIEQYLVRRQSIESRAMTFFIKEGMHEQFRIAFEKSFSGSYMLLTKQQVLDRKLFGSGTPHPRSLGFIGDYLAVATGNIAIECNPAPEHGPFKATHAGLTADEMDVPFIAIECL